MIWHEYECPKGWRLVGHHGPVGGRYTNSARGLAVILDSAEWAGEEWVHFSLSHSKRIPTWGELRVAKLEFLGDAYAYMAFPPREFYVNLHPNVLHLYHRPSGPPMPEFSGDTVFGRSV